MEKTQGRGTRRNQMLCWAQDPCQSAIFHILHKRGGALTSLKCFWSTNTVYVQIFEVRNFRGFRS